MRFASNPECLTSEPELGLTNNSLAAILIDFCVKFSCHRLGAVDLSGLKFIQFKTDLIAARVLTHSHSIKKASNNESICFK